MATIHILLSVFKLALLALFLSSKIKRIFYLECKQKHIKMVAMLVIKFIKHVKYWLTLYKLELLISMPGNISRYVHDAVHWLTIEPFSGSIVAVVNITTTASNVMVILCVDLNVPLIHGWDVWSFALKPPVSSLQVKARLHPDHHSLCHYHPLVPGCHSQTVVEVLVHLNVL